MTDEVLYLEVDEDITSAIDKLTKAKGSQITIVAPKRSSLIQSLINLKLLQKSAADAGKSIVLVTGDRTATHMAGRLGMAVAATLKGKPSVPEAPDTQPTEATEIIEDSDDDADVADADQPAVVPAAAIPVSTPKVSRRSLIAPVGAAVATADGDAESSLGATATGLAASDVASPKGIRIKAPRVPNFQSMQQKVLLAAGIVTTIVVLVAINMFIAKATVTLFAKGTEVDTHFKFTLDPTARTSDIAKSTIIAQSLTASHVLTAPVTATGKKDVGTKATGSITLTNKCYNPGSIPAGTIFTAAGGLSFTSTETVTVPNAIFIFGNCTSTTAHIPVVSKDNGDKYNLAPMSYSNPTLPSSGTVYVTLQGGQMSGGTSKKVDVITQADLDAAKKAAVDKDKEIGLKEVNSKVATDYVGLPDTFAQAVADTQVSPAVDAEASSATATIKVEYTLLAYNKPDLAALVKREQEKQVGADSQIYDDGAGDAKITGPAAPGGVWLMNYQTKAYAGTKLDKEKIAKSIAGKRYGDAADIAGKLPGVEKVEISLWPSWTTAIPSFTNHITITIKIAPRG